MTQDAETVEKPKGPAVLQEGQVSIMVEGREVVFQPDQMELPGMPDMGRLRRIAAAYVTQARKVAEARDGLQRLNQEAMLELRNEGRTGFAYRDAGKTWSFMIDAPAEQLIVKVKAR